MSSTCWPRFASTGRVRGGVVAATAVLFAIAVQAAAFGAVRASDRVVTGKSTPLENGSVYTWIQRSASGTPVAIGVTFTDASLQNLPSMPPSGKMSFEDPLSLPDGVLAPPFNHISVDWDPMGHPPPGIYDKPHFDIHFYFLSPAQRDQITATGADLAICEKKLPTEYTPAGYILPPGTQYPRMGTHWADVSAPEFHHKPFMMTLVYGSYDGKLAFIEPMISLAYFKSKQSVTLPVSLPPAYQQHGYYPTKYCATYANHKYTVALEGLVYR